MVVVKFGCAAFHKRSQKPQLRRVAVYATALAERLKPRLILFHPLRAALRIPKCMKLN